MDTRKYYFDHASTTYIYQEVIEQYKFDLENYFANPASAHKLGKILTEKIDDIKNQFVALIGGARSDSFYFVSSATEGNNAIINGIQLEEQDEIVYTLSDHPSVTVPIEKIKCKKLQLDIYQDGSINIERLKETVTSNTKLVVLTLVNNQSGNIHQVNQLAKIIKSINKNCHIHLDAVQGIAKINYQITPEIDSLTFSGHKLGAPKGIAGLFIKNGIKINPLIVGGGQQNSFRAGTENYPLYNAFLLAFKISKKKYAENIDGLTKLNLILKNRLQDKIEDLIFPFESTSPFILTFIAPKVPADVLIRVLETKNYYLSSTSACSSKVKAFNPVLAALKIDEAFHKNVIRISINFEFNNELLEDFVESFSCVYSDLRRLSKK